MADVKKVGKLTELKDEKVAIIGSGLIGRSWAMLFACGGYKVSLYDTDLRQLEGATADIRDQLKVLSEGGLGRGTLSADVQFSRISTCTSLEEAVKGATYVQECIPELRELKRKVLKAIDDLMTSATILASSTSATMPSLLSDHLTNKGRFIVAHPANPPFYVPIVEIVPAPWTDMTVATATSDIMDAIGQVPVVFYKEADGFAFGRIQFAIMAAAYELIKNDVCDVDAIETAMVEGLGMWYAFYGPFQVEHLNAEGFVDLCNKYGEDAYNVQLGFAPPERMGGETAQKMGADLEKFCPLDQLPVKRQWRDARLVALSRLVHDLDKESASGQIGGSWALLFASAGYRVSLYDIDTTRVTKALEIIHEQLQVLSREGLLRGTLSAEEQYDRIHAMDDLQGCVVGACYIQECVPEKEDLKRELFTQMDTWLSDTAILASSTSSFLPSAMSRDLKHRENFLVVHPTNPPFYTRAVELVPAPWTTSDTMAKTKELMAEIGQTPIILRKEIPGFVLNRMQYAIMAESYRLVKNGVLSMDGVNKMMSAGLGRRYAFLGPFQTAHLNAEGFGSYCDRYADMIFRVQQSFGPPELMSGNVVEEIEKELVKEVPLDKLGEARSERGRRLGALMKLKKDLNEAEKQGTQGAQLG